MIGSEVGKWPSSANEMWGDVSGRSLWESFPSLHKERRALSPVNGLSGDVRPEGPQLPCREGTWTSKGVELLVVPCLRRILFCLLCEITNDRRIWTAIFCCMQPWYCWFWGRPTHHHLVLLRTEPRPRGTSMCPGLKTSWWQWGTRASPPFS